MTGNNTLYDLNAGKLMMPASALKVVTLAAAAERLGWNYSYETRIVAEGTVRGDTVVGGLVVVGGGDPSLDRVTLESWADQLKAMGIVRITGTVRADGRLFSGESLGSGWSWDDVAYYYAAPIAAAQFNENAVELRLRPGPSAGTPATFELSPAVSGLQVDNRTRTGSANEPVEFVARRAPGSSSVVLEGVVPLGTAAVVRALSVPDPPSYLAAAFAAALASRGISLEDIRATTPSSGQDSPVVLLTHRSAPLSVLARRLMEVSQNQYAETLIKTIGVQSGTPTFEGGLKAVEFVLASWGIAAESVVLRDGSGLSRYDYIAPDTLAQVLTRMHRDPAHQLLFFPLLNVAAQTGTLVARLKDTAAAGNVRAKDGSMAGVRTLCGIVTTRDGEVLVFAILANNFSVPGPDVTAAIDAIVVRLAEFSRTTRRSP